MMDPFSLQKAVKDNADDLVTYLRDLKNWETDIKKKDAQLRGVDLENEKLYPEIRSKPKKTDENKNTDDVKSQKKKKISAFDYESWDKLDMEKVCEEIDSNEEEMTKEMAMYEKEKGNNHVKAGNWDKALSCYTKAIKAYPRDAIFFANRALCYLKLKNFQKAEFDCSKAISLDSSYVKAWLRRSAAWEGLKNMENAKRDLERVIKLEPHNKEAVLKLAALKKVKELESKQSDEKASGDGTGIGDSDSNGKHNDSDVTLDNEGHLGGDLPWKDYKGEIIQPITKPPHLRSKKPLRRVPVEEGDEKESSCLVGARESVADVVATPGSSKPNIPRVSSCGDLETMEPAPSELPTPPKSSVQFLVNWKRLKTYPEMALMYLMQIPPESLPSVFGDSLEISILEEILNILGLKVGKSTPVENPVSQSYSTYEFLKHLSNVPRFSTLAMFLNSEEQVVSRQILAHCVKNGECTTEEGADLAGKFML